MKNDSGTVINSETQRKDFITFLDHISRLIDYPIFLLNNHFQVIHKTLDVPQIIAEFLFSRLNLFSPSFQASISEADNQMIFQPLKSIFLTGAFLFTNPAGQTEYIVTEPFINYDPDTRLIKLFSATHDINEYDLRRILQSVKKIRESIMLGKLTTIRNLTINHCRSQKLSYDLHEEMAVKQTLLHEQIRNKANYEGLLNSISNCVLIILDKAMICEQIEGDYQKLRIFNKEKLLFHKLTDIFPTRLKKLIIEAFQKTFLHNTPALTINHEDMILRLRFSRAPEAYQKIIMIAEDVTHIKMIEQELQLRKENLKSLFNAITESVYYLNPQGKILAANDTAANRIGYSNSSHIINLNIFDLINDKLKVFLHEKLINLMLTGKAQKAEFDLENNRLFFSFYPTHINENEVNAISIFVQDITQQKIDQEKIKAQLKFQESLIEGMPFPVFYKDTEGHLLGGNQSFFKLFRRDPANIIGKLIEEFEPSFVADFFLGKDKELLEQEGIQTFEQKLIREKETVDCLFYRTLFRNEKDEVVGIIGAIIDLTELRKIQNAYESQERKYRNLINNLNIGVIVINEGKIEIFNSIAEKLLGLKIFENDSFNSLLNQEVLNEDMQNIVLGTLPIFRNYSERKNNLFGIKRQKRTRWILGNYFPVVISTDNKQQQAFIFADITELKRAQDERKELIRDLENKNLELENFSYSVSHDLKSPLVTIKGFSGNLLKDIQISDFSNLEGDLHRIDDAAKKMSELLDGLLHLSRIGRIINAPETVDINDTVNSVINMLYASINKRNIIMKIDKQLPPCHGDRQRIHEVFQNLVENSVKFMGETKNPIIEITGNEEKDMMIYRVKDNGEGIATDYHSSIFRLFDKLDNKTEGSGVGLSLVKRIIEVHGGKVWVESEGLKRGSTFIFTLPKPRGNL